MSFIRVLYHSFWLLSDSWLNGPTFKIETKVRILSKVSDFYCTQVGLVSHDSDINLTQISYWTIQSKVRHDSAFPKIHGEVPIV